VKLAFGIFKKKICVGNQVGGTSISTILVIFWKKWNGIHGLTNANP
jgi:hypothetical protein